MTFGAENETRAQACLSCHIRVPQSASGRQPLGGGPRVRAGKPGANKTKKRLLESNLFFGAENETRTRDPNLGKVVLLFSLQILRICTQPTELFP